MEEFIVKHYADDPHPTIKGNGFDGLVVGDYRDETEKFIKFINGLIHHSGEDCEECRGDSAYHLLYNKCYTFCPKCGRKLPQLETVDG